MIMANTMDRLSLLERQAVRVEMRMDRLSERSNLLKVQQLMVFIAGIVVTISLLAVVRWLGGLAFLAALVGFFVIMGQRKKVDLSYLKHKSLLQLLQAQIARVRLDWQEIPSVPFESPEKNHPFELDLDITGERSLLHLINTAVSFEGIQLLGSWLLSRVPDLDGIYRRQALIRELTPLTRFRDKLMLYSLFATRLSADPLVGDRIITWLEKQVASPIKQRFWTLLVAILLSILLYVAVILFAYFQVSALFCVGAAVLSVGWFMLTRREQGNLADDAQYMTRTLGQLNIIFEYLEKYPYAPHSRLKQLCEPFYLHRDHSPSLLLKRLAKIMSRASLANDETSWTVVNMLLPVGAYTAYQLDRQKVLLANYLSKWLNAWYELEALSSLANFAYLNPDYVVPKIVAPRKPDSVTLFHAQALGHPLIDKEKKVANDFQLDTLLQYPLMDRSNEENLTPLPDSIDAGGSNRTTPNRSSGFAPGQVVIVTGSNMSGKSTFLRTIGINLCLAYAGSVVNATSLQTSLFEICACIRVTDSLADGYSYFYAEVRRLRDHLQTLMGDTTYPLFLLIDEIFRGTNNYERLVGSASYIQALIGQKCVAAISTHDLELVKLADTCPDIRNEHFREDVVDGAMVFDYVLRQGPSPTRNALKIMEMEGLPVKWDAADRILGVQ
jgi:MutS domain V